jgi:hypothetical protein
VSVNSPTEEPSDHPINPYAPPHTAPTKPQNVQQNTGQTNPWFRRACIFQLIIIFAALGLEAIDVETIVATGPLYLLAGIFTSYRAYREANAMGLLIGFSAIFLTGLIFALINLNNWSPTVADRPVSIIIWSYSAIAVPLLYFILPGKRWTLGYQ